MTGESNGSAKLTRADVMAIRDAHELRQETMTEVRRLRSAMKSFERELWRLERKVAPLTMDKLAQRYGVARSTINDAIYDKTWQGVL